MSETTQGYRPQAGDVVEVAKHRLGGSARVGEILQAVGEPGHEHFRVRWEVGKESVFYPSNGATVRPRHAAAKEKP